MKRNMELWDRYGDHLIPVQPFMDNVIVRTEGSWLIDADGKRLLDLASGQFCTILGHNHPDFVRRLTEELARCLHTGSQYVTDTVLETLAKVARISPPGLDNVILLSTGSEANEFALRVAKVYTGRTGAIGFDRGYYGISLMTRNLSAISEGKVDASPRSPEIWHFIAPNCARCPLKLEYPSCEIACLDLSIRMLGHRAENIAAIIVEPIVSAGGMIYPTREYFARLKAFAEDIGALLILDEAQTGFGRCGRWFDCENLELSPDILVFSKTSGNGYPSSGVVIGDKLKQKLLDRGFHHLSSHQNDSLTAAAVSAVIDIIERENYISYARETGEYFLARLRELEQRHEHLWGARGRGLMLAFELVKDKQSREPHHDMLTPFVLACKEKGVHVTYTYYEGVIRIITGLNLTREEIDFATTVFDEVLTEIARGQLRAADYEQRNKVMRARSERSRTRQLLDRVWETSPRYWYERLRRR